MPDTPYMAIQVGGYQRNSQRFAALIDVADEATLAAHRWSMTSDGYAVREVWIGGKRLAVRMHRQILDLAPSDPRDVDHINGDKLDNRRANLRVCTRSQNMQNRQHRPARPYRGAAWDAQVNRWRAYAKLAKKQHHLGFYDTKEEAAAVAAAFRSEHMPYSADARDETKEVEDES
jgi:hypothetical protein